MLILLAILILLLIMCIMLVLRLLWPKFGIQGFLAVLAVLIGWVLVLMSYSDIPQTVTLLSWQPDTFFPNSPSLLIDDISWYFAIAVMSIALTSMVTSISHLGQSLISEHKKTEKSIEVIEIQVEVEKEIPPDERVGNQARNNSTLWRSWVGILFLSSLGLLAVTSGNIITLLLAWVALDLAELIYLFSQVIQSRSQERIILAFSARMTGIALVILACIIPWSQNGSLSFTLINQTTSIYLILAVIFRLGILPLQLSSGYQFHQKREVDTLFHLVPASASYILLVRVADIGILGVLSPILLAFTALAGLYASIRWLTAGNGLFGRSYWLLGTASLAIASAILNRPFATIAWSIASLLSGGLILSMSIRHKNLIPIILLGTFCFSALPFSPTWLGTDLYRFTGSPSNPLNPAFYYILLFVFLLIQSLMLAGIFRYSLQTILSSDGQSEIHVERWVWFLYPAGLIIIIMIHFLTGILQFPTLKDMPLTGWIMGAISVTIAGTIWYLSRGYIYSYNSKHQVEKPFMIGSFFSSERLYLISRSLFRIVIRLTSLISVILEGDGGILWAFVLFALIFVFLRR